MRPIELLLKTAPVLAALWACALPVPAAAGTPACFCLENGENREFLWGCREFTPPNAVTVRAFCRHPRTGEESFSPLMIRPPWRRIEEGEGDCTPCRPWENEGKSPLEVPREGDKKAEGDEAPPGE